MSVFELTNDVIDSRELTAQLRDPSAGALATFEGWVRNHNEGKAVRSLRYEAYDALAVTEGTKILQEAVQQFDVVATRCAHRTGHLQVGDLAVWVGVSAAHRRSAMDACAWIINQIKLRVPIWKQEVYADGDSQWVNCASCVHAAVTAVQDRA